VAALYEQGRVHHIGAFPQLEDQMTNFTSDIDRAAAGYSPDRSDALIWAFSELLVEPMKGEAMFELARRNAEAAEQRASHNLLSPCMPPARGNGSPRRTKLAKPLRRSATAIHRRQPSGRGVKELHRGRGTEGSNPPPSSDET
jgi:hypothetical protein